MKIPGLLVRNSVKQETSHVGNCLCVVPRYTLVEVCAYVFVCVDCVHVYNVCVYVFDVYVYGGVYVCMYVYMYVYDACMRWWSSEDNIVVIVLSFPFVCVLGVELCA